MTAQQQTHRHPKPWLKVITEFGSFVTALIMLTGAALLCLGPLWGAPGGLILTGLLLTLLSVPVWMLTAYAPAVSIDEDSITLHPKIWADRKISWNEIALVTVYPLLPTTDEEVVRRFAVGQRNYQPARGIMLVIPSLPIQYRIVGFFAGAKGQGAIALTNRSHADYEELVQAVLHYTDSSRHDEALYD